MTWSKTGDKFPLAGIVHNVSDAKYQTRNIRRDASRLYGRGWGTEYWIGAVGRRFPPPRGWNKEVGWRGENLLNWM
jgi:hypothetical protein